MATQVIQEALPQHLTSVGGEGPHSAWAKSLALSFRKRAKAALPRMT